MKRPSELDRLAHTGWLRDTPESFRAELLSRCSVKRLGRDMSLYRANDPPGGLYGLIEGRWGVEMAPADRDAYVALVVQPGFWIGEASLVARVPRVVGVRCSVDTVVAHLPLPEWDAIVRKDPEAWRWLCLLVLRNEVLAVRVADALLVRRASGRVAALLIVMATTVSFGEGDLALAPIDIDLGKQHLARMANLSRSSVERILQSFAAEGLIESSYRHIRILDVEGLQKHRAIPD